MHAKSLQSCPTLCDPMDCSPPAPLSMGFSRQGYWSGLPYLSPGDLPNPGIEPGCPPLQADSLTPEPPGKSKKTPYSKHDLVLNHFSCVQFFVTLWTVAHQLLCPWDSPAKSNWSGLPFPSPGDLPNPVIEPRSPALQADALTSEPPGT